MMIGTIACALIFVMLIVASVCVSIWAELAIGTGIGFLVFACIVFALIIVFAFICAYVYRAKKGGK